MDFYRADKFDDLVDANLRFLRGELNWTPGHYAPLESESYIIRDAMIAMCSELRAMTTNSQPAYVTELRRQRGYVSVFIRINKDIFTIAERLLKSGLVCAISKNTGLQTSEACLSWDETTDKYNDVSQTRSTSKANWKGRSSFNPLHGNSSEIIEHYDTYLYRASLDRSLVCIHAADYGWGYPADHCIKTVHQVLKELTIAA